MAPSPFQPLSGTLDDVLGSPPLPASTFGECSVRAVGLKDPFPSVEGGEGEAALLEHPCFSFCTHGGEACRGERHFSRGPCLECCEDLCRAAAGAAPRLPEPLASILQRKASDRSERGAERAEDPAVAKANRALAVAILGGDVEAVRASVESLGARPNACLGCRSPAAPLEVRPCGQCFHGSFSSLHLVAEQFKTNPSVNADVWPEMVRVLAGEYGADPNLLDWQPAESPELRTTPLDWLLSAHDAPGDAGRALPTAAALLDAGADVNWARWNGWTLLMLAAERAAFTGPELVRRIVEAGADLQAVNARGQSPLHTAAQCWAFGNTTCGGEGTGYLVPWLVERGADADARDNGGDTTLAMIRRACLNPVSGEPPGPQGLCDDRGAEGRQCRWGPCDACCAADRFLAEVTDPDIVAFDARAVIDGRAERA